MPRFVLLYHECPPGFEKPSHWDFMLESAGVLQTWELCALPAPWCAAIGNVSPGIERVVPTQRLADHRIEYLDYEGPLSGGRGSVSRVASGEFEVLEETPRSLVMRLIGKSIQGTVELTELDQFNRWSLKA